MQGCSRKLQVSLRLSHGTENPDITVIWMWGKSYSSKIVVHSCKIHYPSAFDIFFFQVEKVKQGSYPKDLHSLRSVSLTLHSNPRLFSLPCLSWCLCLSCPRLAIIPWCDQRWRNHIHRRLLLRDAPSGNKLLSGEWAPPEHPVCCAVCITDTPRASGGAK